MRIRKQALGNRNIVGAKIEARRKELGMKQVDLLAQLQVKGIELTASLCQRLRGRCNRGNTGRAGDLAARKRIKQMYRRPQGGLFYCGKIDSLSIPWSLVPYSLKSIDFPRRLWYDLNIKGEKEHPL